MKKLVLAICILAVVAVPVCVFAADSGSSAAKAIRGFFKFDVQSLTEKQKADMVDSFVKVMEARKEAVKKMTENGAIAKEQGEAMVARIDMEIEYYKKYGLASRGRLFDPSALTEEQKADMLNSFIKVMEAKKDAIRKMMENGTIDKEQGESMISGIDEQIKYHQENGFTSGKGWQGIFNGGRSKDIFGGAKGRGGMGQWKMRGNIRNGTYPKPYEPTPEAQGMSL